MIYQNYNIGPWPSDQEKALYQKTLGFRKSRFDNRKCIYIIGTHGHNIRGILTQNTLLICDLWVRLTYENCIQAGTFCFKRRLSHVILNSHKFYEQWQWGLAARYCARSNFVEYSLISSACDYLEITPWVVFQIPPQANTSAQTKSLRRREQ